MPKRGEADPTTPLLARSTQARHAPRTVFRELAGEAVLLNLETSEYYGLDPVGTRIWALLAEEEDLGGVHQRILEELEVEPERAWEDLVALVEDLRDNGLVVIAPQR
jgi:hypothetical protein